MSRSRVTGIRVVLDLGGFFEGGIKKIYHYIPFSQNKIVRDIYEDIESFIGNNSEFSLEVNGCLVPESEDIRVLCNEDVIKVINVNNCRQSKQNFAVKYNKRRRHKDDTEFAAKISSNSSKQLDSETQEENESNELVVVPKAKKTKKLKNTVIKECKYEKDIEKNEQPSKKRKTVSNIGNSSLMEYEESVEIEESDGNKDHTLLLNSKGRKESSGNFVDHSLGTHVQENEVETYDKEGCPENHFHVQTHKLDPNLFASGIKNPFAEKNTISLESKASRLEKSEVLNNNVEVCVESEDSKPKRKRRRRVKKSPKALDKDSGNNCFAQPYVPPVAPMSLNGSQKMNKHIKFVDEDDHVNISNVNNLNDTCNDNVDEIGSKCSPSKSHSELESLEEENINCVKNENYCVFFGENENNTSKQSNVFVASTSSIFTNSSKSIYNSFVNEKPSSPRIFECKRTNRSTSIQNVPKENEPDFTKYPVLNSQPRPNDIIVFKKLKMDANYSPTLSDYITSKVLRVSENDGTVTLRILNGHLEFKEPCGKFSMEEEEIKEDSSEKSKEIIVEEVQMNISDLLDVRLLFP